MTWWLLASMLAVQAPTRDVVAPPRAGDGIIMGTVVTDEAEPRPLRGVRVMLESGTLGIPQAAVTDESGRFAFIGLVPGNYALQAVRPSYVTTYYGARKPGRGPGVPIAIGAGQRVSGVVMKMLRGAVITGIVRRPGGKPAADVSVQARRLTIVNGQRRLEYAPGAMTDDRGEYRIFGLAPGDYVIQVSAPSVSANDMRRITPAEIAAGQALLRPGAPANPAPSAPDPGPSVSYAAVYFPGTTDSNAAQTLAISAGQERGGVDVTLQFVLTARVTGVAIGPDGRAPQNLRFTLMPKPASGDDSYSEMYTSVSARPDGSFSAAGVRPGRYLLTARAALPMDAAVSAPAARGEPPPGVMPGPGVPAPALTLWGVEELDVNGRDVSGIVVRLQQGMTVTGRVVIEAPTVASPMPPPDRARVRVMLPPVAASGTPAQEASFLGASNIAVDKDGTFVIRGAAPGTYRFSVITPGNFGGQTAPGVPAWGVRSILTRGRDVADLPLEIKPGEDVDDVVITISDRSTEITGTVFDQLNRPTPGFPIVVFSTNRAHWPAGTNRVRQAQPASDGTYRIAGLPAGEYFVCAVTDLEQTDLQDPGFLESLAAVSFKITLAVGEKKSQDLRLGGK